MNTRERLKLFLTSINISEGSFEKATGLAKGFVSKVGDSIRTSSLEKIKSVYPSLNTSWLLTGDGDMLTSKAEIAKDTNADEITKKNGYITYLLPMSAMGGSLTGFAEPGVLLQNCEAVVSPIENVDFAITVYGDSMAPEYPSGSRILIKKINPNLFIEWGKVYVLDTPNGVIVKEVHESNKEGYVSCYSLNPNPKFKPFDVLMDEVFGMYRVLMCLSAK